MPKLKFRDFKTQKNFETDEFQLITTKNGRRAAKTVAPSGMTVQRFVAKDFRK